MHCLNNAYTMEVTKMASVILNGKAVDFDFIVKKKRNSERKECRLWRMCKSDGCRTDGAYPHVF